MKIRIATLLSLLLLTGPARAAEVSFERNPSLPLVYINVAVRAGSVTDPEGQGGITNFMGEMLLRGTRSRTKEQIDLELDQMGAELEVETRAEALIFRGAVLSSQLERYLKLLGEILTRPAFPEAEMRKLKSEIVSSILDELGNDAALGARAHARFLFSGHPYGKPILGTVNEVEKLSREQVMSQYDRLVRDRTLLVLGSGDAETARIQDWARGVSKARPGGLDAVKVRTPQEAPARRLLLVDKPDRTQTQIYLGQIGMRMTDPSYFPLYVANHAFGGGSFSARLMTEVRVKRGWSYGASSSFRQGLQPRSWTVYLFPKAAYTPDALALVLSMLDSAKSQGLKTEEFEFAKRSLVNGVGFMFNTPKKRVENRLLERTLDLPDGFLKSYGPRILAVTLAESNSALAAFLKPTQVAITVVGTANQAPSEGGMTLKDGLARAAGIPSAQVEVVPYQKE
jgi:zinc protease